MTFLPSGFLLPPLPPPSSHLPPLHSSLLFSSSLCCQGQLQTPVLKGPSCLSLCSSWADTTVLHKAFPVLSWSFTAVCVLPEAHSTCSGCVVRGIVLFFHYRQAFSSLPKKEHACLCRRTQHPSFLQLETVVNLLSILRVGLWWCMSFIQSLLFYEWALSQVHLCCSICLYFIPFLLMNNISLSLILIFLHSTTNEHLRFLLLAVMNNAVLDVCIQGLVWFTDGQCPTPCVLQDYVHSADTRWKGLLDPAL